MAKKKKSQKITRFKTHHKVIFSLLMTVAAVAVWRGIWNFFDTIPMFTSPLISLGFAAIVLMVAGIFFKVTDF